MHLISYLYPCTTYEITNPHTRHTLRDLTVIRPIRIRGNFRCKAKLRADTAVELQESTDTLAFECLVFCKPRQILRVSLYDEVELTMSAQRSVTCSVQTVRPIVDKYSGLGHRALVRLECV